MAFPNFFSNSRERMQLNWESKALFIKVVRSRRLGVVRLDLRNLSEEF